MTRPLTRPASLVCRWALLALCMAWGVATRTALAQEAKPTGEVIVSVTSNTGSFGMFDSLVVRPASEPSKGKHTFELRQMIPGLSRDTAIYAGTLEAGDYVLERIRAGKTYLELGEKSLERIGEIHVEAHNLSDLGRIIIFGYNGKYWVGRSALILSNTDLIARFAPELAPKGDLKRISGWLRPRQETDEVEAAAQTNPIATDELQETATGEVLAAGRLGVLFVRGRGGAWRGLRTGRLESLFSVRVVNEPTLTAVAAGEFNTLVAVDPRGQVSIMDPGDLPSGNLLFIDGDSATGWTVAQQTGKAVTFFHAARLQKGEWKPVRTEVLKIPFWNVHFTERFQFWHTVAGFAYVTFSGDLHFYDRKTGQWVDRPHPAGGNVLAVASSGSRGLSIVVDGGTGLLHNLPTVFFSSDEGRTWEPLTHPCPLVTTHEDGALRLTGAAPVMHADGTLVMWSWFGAGKAAVYRSKDRGKTWEKTNQILAKGANLAVLPLSGMFAFDDGRLNRGVGAIYHSDNGGTSWTLEFSNYQQAR